MSKEIIFADLIVLIYRLFDVLFLHNIVTEADLVMLKLIVGWQNLIHSLGGGWQITCKFV